MDMFTTIYVFFMLFGTVHATAWKPKIYIPGDNVTVHIDQLDINEQKRLEITFSGYTSKLHVTNVMLYTPMKNQPDINTNYDSRIARVNLYNGNLSFILLNVSFFDSGNYTVFEHSLEKGKTSIIVPHHRILGQNNEPLILSFTCNITNITSIKIERMIGTIHHEVLKYVTKENNTKIGNMFLDRIEGCVVKENIFSFTIRKVTLPDMGMYVAWSDMNILMDSALLEFEERNSTSSSERTPIYFTSTSAPKTLQSMAENYILEWIFVSAVVVLFLAAGLIVNTLRRIINMTISKTTGIHLTHMNERQSIANASCSRSNNTGIRNTNDGSRMPLEQNNISHALTDFTPPQNQDVTTNGAQSFKRSENSVCSTVGKEMMHHLSSPSCETFESDSTFDYHQYDKATFPFEESAK